jgi:hypothetical protein
MALDKTSLKDKLEDIFDVGKLISAAEIKKAWESLEDLEDDDEFFGVFSDVDELSDAQIDALNLKTARDGFECAALIAVALKDYISTVHIDQTAPSNPGTAGAAMVPPLTAASAPDVTANPEAPIPALPMGDILGLDDLIDEVRIAIKTSIDAQAKPWAEFVAAYDALLTAHVAWVTTTPATIDPAIPGTVALGNSADMVAVWDEGLAGGSAASAQKFADEIHRSTTEAKWTGNLVNPPGLTATALYMAVVVNAPFK